MVLKVEDLEIYQMAEDLSDKIWQLCIKLDYFARDTVGKQMVRAADSISANLAGIPGISVPGGLSSMGLPIGIQLQAAHFEENKLLRAAYNLELRTNLANMKPTGIA